MSLKEQLCTSKEIVNSVQGSIIGI